MQAEGNHNGEPLVDTLKDYVNTRYELTKLQLVDSASNLLAEMIGFFLMLIAGLFFLLFLSYAIANYLCDVMDSKYAGYFIVAGFYLVVTLILLAVKEKSIHVPLENRFIRQFLK